MSLGYEQVYSERLEETKSMITLATLLDFLDQGVGDGVDYQFTMAKARDIADKANHQGLPAPTPNVSLVSSVIRSNVKIMIYNIIEFAVTSMVQAIYDKLNDEGCGYAEASEELRNVWHHARMRRLNDPSASNVTAEHLSKKMLDHVIANAALSIEARQTISAGNLDGAHILRLFKDHGVLIHPEEGNYRQDVFQDIKDRRNELAHGSTSFTDAGNQVTTSELADLVDNVDSFLAQLHKDIESYLRDEGYRAQGGFSGNV